MAKRLTTWARKTAGWRGENRVHVVGVEADRTLCGRDVPADAWAWDGTPIGDEMCLVCERLAMFAQDGD